MSLSAREIDVKLVSHVFQMVKMKENAGQWKLRRLRCFAAILH